MGHILKQDFPGKRPSVVEKVLMYLKSESHDTWLGALVCLHQLIRHFKYAFIRPSFYPKIEIAKL